MTSLKRSESGRHVVAEAASPPSYRRAPVECTECMRDGTNCEVFEGDGHGRCRFCTHHRACHLDVASVCTDCTAMGRRCEKWKGTGANCKSCGHGSSAHGLKSAIGGIREPVKCSECKISGRECKVFQGDGTRHCVNCGHHDVCHEDAIVAMVGTRHPVKCTECELKGAKCDTYKEWRDRQCEFCGHHDVCHQAIAVRVPAAQMEAALASDLSSVRRGY